MSILSANLRQLVASGTDPVKIRRALLLVAMIIEDLQRQIDELAEESEAYVRVMNDDGFLIYNDEHDFIWTTETV